MLSVGLARKEIDVPIFFLRKMMFSTMAGKKENNEAHVYDNTTQYPQWRCQDPGAGGSTCV